MDQHVYYTHSARPKGGIGIHGLSNLSITKKEKILQTREAKGKERLRRRLVSTRRYLYVAAFMYYQVDKLRHRQKPDPALDDGEDRCRNPVPSGSTAF